MPGLFIRFTGQKRKSIFVMAIILMLTLTLWGCGGGGGGGGSAGGGETTDGTAGGGTDSGNDDSAGGGDDGSGGQEPPAPSTPAWVAKRSMPTPRSGMQAVAVNGRIYVLGGSQGNTTLTTVEAYDPTTDTWTANLADIPVAIKNFAAAAINGTVFVAGGWPDGEKAVYAYHPATDTWTVRRSMLQARYSHEGAALDGKLYVAGGWYTRRTPSGYATDYLDSAEFYDPASDTWTYVTDMPFHKDNAACAALDGKLHVIGGSSLSGGVNNQDYVYDPEINNWSQGVDLLSPRRQGAAAAVSGGKIYVIGGNGVEPDQITAAYYDLASVEVFDPARATWSSGPALFKPDNGGAAAVVNGVIYYFYGDDLGTVEALAP